MTTHVTCRRRGYGIPRLYPRSCPTLAPLTRAKVADYRIEPLIVKSLIWSTPSERRAGCSMNVDKCFSCVVKAATYLRRRRTGVNYDDESAQFISFIFQLTPSVRLSHSTSARVFIEYG